jgi:hypothetical protein
MRVPRTSVTVLVRASIWPEIASVRPIHRFSKWLKTLFSVRSVWPVALLSACSVVAATWAAVRSASLTALPRV